MKTQQTPREKLANSITGAGREAILAQPQTSHSPLPITEAYDIKNVDIRNLLTIVVGTLSNQTGESYDSVLSRGKCADEILRRFNELEAKPSDAIPADVYLIIKKQRDADEANLKAHAQRLADALKRIVKDWEKVDENVQVPDCINVDEHWDEAREALAQWEKESPADADAIEALDQLEQLEGGE